uniref:Fibrinogen C-terminal domain-containing protein n=1 Tax=Latimeria chalumnae TaxID=7897 RepID=H3AUF0_LATCH
ARSFGDKIQLFHLYVFLLHILLLTVYQYNSSSGKNWEPPPPTNFYPRDCSAAYQRGRRQNGLYVIRPKGGPFLVVYCDMETDGGGWTVLQRNTHNSYLTWSASWTTYQYGFGNLMDDYWFGSEYIHIITNAKHAFYKAKFLLKNNNKIYEANYYTFNVADESTNYTLRLGSYSGNATDALTSHSKFGIHDNMMFSTKDRDNDKSDKNCADNRGGWWYNNCESALLNTDSNIKWSTYQDC